MESSNLMKGMIAIAIIAIVVTAGWIYSLQENPAVVPVDNEQKVNPIAVVNTSMGEFKIELYEKEFKADKKYDSIRLVDNFKRYAASGFYDGLIIHGVAPWPYGNRTKTLIYTGNYYPELTKKEPIYPPIKYGKRTDVLFGLKHTDLAVSWFDTWNVTSVFYICDGDWSNSGNPQTAWKEPGLDIHDPVFGKIVDGVDVIRKIGSLGHHSEINETGDVNLGYVPNSTVVINHISIYYPETAAETVVLSGDVLFTGDRNSYFSPVSSSVSFMRNL